MFRDQPSFQPGRAVTLSQTPQQQSRRWQTDNRPYIHMTQNRDDSGLGDSQFSTRTEDPYSGGIPRALAESSSKERLQAPLKSSTESQTNRDLRYGSSADNSSRTYSPGTIDIAGEDVENRMAGTNSLDLLVDEWNRDLNPRGRKPSDPKARTSNITEQMPTSGDLVKANKKRTRITQNVSSSTKKARTEPHKKKAPHAKNNSQREDAASDNDEDGGPTGLKSLTGTIAAPTTVTKKVKPTKTKAPGTTKISSNSNIDSEDDSGTSTNEMSQMFGAEVLDKLLKGEKLPEIDGQIKRKQLIEWLHEPEGPGSFMQLAEDMERLWELDVIAATKKLFDQKHLDSKKI